MNYPKSSNFIQISARYPVRCVLCAAVAWLVMLLLLSTPATAKLYKWVDERGNVSYQDKPPPPNHQDTTQVLNAQGVTVERIPGIAEQRQIEAKEKLYALAQRRDKALLDAFPSEQDLTRTRDKRLGLVDGMVTRMHDQLVILNTRLATIEAKIESRAERGLAPLKLLESDRIAVNRGISSTNALIRSKLNERRQIAKKFAADLTRYRELATVSADYND